MSDTKVFEIGPNKKMAVKLLLIFPFLIVMGVILLLGWLGDSVRILGFEISSTVFGIVALVVAFLPILTCIATYKTKKRIYLDESCIRLSDTVSAEWERISHCEIVKTSFIPFLWIYLHDGSKLMISWNQVDCGMDRLCELINDHLLEEVAPGS